jgi:hypothetical protein
VLGGLGLGLGECIESTISTQTLIRGNQGVKCNIRGVIGQETPECCILRVA